jgi:hypothetical protein
MTKVSQKKENDKSHLEPKQPKPLNIHTTVEEITPRKAENWLKRNLSINRAQSPSHIKYLAEQMSSGHWQLNGQSIKFDLSNNLIDGQHRLMAVVESGVSIYSLVVRGVPSDYFYTIDLGKTRTHGNALYFKGYKHYNTLAATINHVRFIHNAYDTSKKSAPHETIEFIENNPGIIDCVDYIYKLVQVSKYRDISVSIGAALFFIMRQKHAELAEEFFYKIYSGVNIKPDSPVLRLRAKMVGAKHQRTRAKQKAAYVIKCWRYYRMGKSMKQLGWNPEKEKFPKII